MSKLSLLILGPGMLGGSLLVELYKSEKYQLTVFLRSPEKAAKVQKLYPGVKTTIGNLEDLKTIEDAVTANDIIINTLSCDDLPSVNSTLKSLEASPKTAAGTPKIYIQTSGGGVYGSLFNTHLSPDTVFSDANPDLINKLAPTAPHRHVDLAIVEFAKTSDAKLVVFIPTTVYGQGWGPFTKLSFQIPYKVRIAIKDGYASYGVEGNTILTHVHIRDIVAAYVTLLDALESDKIDVSTNPYINVANGAETTWLQVAERIAEDLASHNAIETISTKSSGPRPDFFGNSRATSERLSELGWKPTDVDLLGSIKADVETILAAQ